jgi:hypothetical protein
MKKLLTLYALLFALGIWADWPRQTESFEAYFDAKFLPGHRISIEQNWKERHPSAKNVSFAYYTSYGKVVAYWVNYY